jgi:hypothetical protein
VEAYEGVVDWIKDRLDGKPALPSNIRRIPHP